MGEINNFILKHERKILIIICSVVFVYFLVLSSAIETQWAQDSHWYMSLTKNIVSESKYSLDGRTPFGQYPPGFSLLLLPLYLMVKNIHIAGLIVVGLFSLLTILITYKIGKIYSPLVGLVAVILLMFHNLFIFNTVSVMTEIPFMFFSLLGLYLFIRGFENPNYFVFAFPVIAFSCLVRYAGFFLIFPMLFYSFVNWNKTKKIIFSDKIIVGILLGLFMFFSWCLRNFLAFGNPFYTSYYNRSFEGILSFFAFGKLFFELGFVFPLFALFGIFCLIKSRNKEMLTFLVWFIFYFILHASWWGGGVFRFYVGILPVICLFSSFGIINVARRFKTRKKSFVFISIILSLIILSQLFIFFSGVINHETTIKTLDRYASIKHVSEWANQTLPENSIYFVPDIAVYSMYLPREKIIYYGDGLNNLLQNPSLVEKTFLFADTLHTWITEPFLNGEKGTIRIPLSSGKSLVLQTSLVKREEYKDRYTILLNVTNIGIQ